MLLRGLPVNAETVLRPHRGQSSQLPFDPNGGGPLFLLTIARRTLAETLDGHQGNLDNHEFYIFMISFHANHVVVTREEWGDLVVLSAHENLASERYLMLQAKDRYDDQDVRFGMNDIYIETCGQGWCWYGNIELFELTRNSVSVQLSNEAATRMSNDGQIEVTLSLDETAYARLRKTLQKIFQGKDYYRD